MSRFALSLFAGAAITLAAGTVSAGKPKPPKLFTLQYCWGYPGFDESCPAADLTLYSDHTLFATDQTTGETGAGTWQSGKRGSTITFALSAGVTYQGSQTTPGCYEGTMGFGLPGWPTGFWAGCYQ